MMPRLPRLDLPNIPQHVVQRGNDRKPCFFEPSDYARYLSELAELSSKLDCALHAYVLMTNHVHLLVTPASPGAVSRLMQSLGRRYVRYINTKYRRIGTLWEGRFKSALVDSHGYALACHRYIELNPVRADIVTAPGEYRWSSYRANAGATIEPMLTPAAAYTALGEDATSRADAYRAFVACAEVPDEIVAIRARTRGNHALGSTAFRAEIEAALGRRAGPGVRGRPRLPSDEGDAFENVL